MEGHLKWAILLAAILPVSSCTKEKPALNTGAPSSYREIRVVNDMVNGMPIVIAGAEVYRFMVAYGREMPDGKVLDFHGLPTLLPVIMEDDEGNLWDVSGVAVRGPRQGQQLPVIHSLTGYWFAWGAMYPGLEIFEGPLYEDDFSPAMPSPGWTVPAIEVISGSGFDLIPALDFPLSVRYREKETWDNQFFLTDTSRVIGVKAGNKYRLYPSVILDFHEIVNDTIDGRALAVAYHPLSGTATAWSRELPGGTTTFGVSGFLYNSNLIAFDRATESLWSQMRGECINGPYLGWTKEFFPVLETTWATWKILLREPDIMSFETGYVYNYSQSPFNEYAQSETAGPFPFQYEDRRLPPKERVLGVIVEGQAKAYRFSSFSND
jgi:hypothetical protein